MGYLFIGLMEDYEAITIILVYQAPSSNKQILIALEVFSEMTINTTRTTTVLGDFNENMLTDCTDRVFYRYFQSHHFEQFVRNPTTDAGSLLDCVYMHKATDTLKIFTSDCYYSDHDWIVIQMLNRAIT